MTRSPAPHPTDAPATEATWFTSSYSGHNNGNCVEVSTNPTAVRVRDSKDRDGGTLTFTADAWHAFTALTASGALDFGVVRD